MITTTYYTHNRITDDRNERHFFRVDHEITQQHHQHAKTMSDEVMDQQNAFICSNLTKKIEKIALRCCVVCGFAAGWVLVE